MRVFGMLRSGELEGQQDEWAHWWILVSAVERTQQGLMKPSSNPGGLMQDEETDDAAKGEAHRKGKRSDSSQRRAQTPPKLPSDAGMSGSKEIATQEAGEAPIPTSPSASYVHTARWEEGDYYTVDEVARILEVSPACIRQVLRAGELEGERREERVEGVLGPWRIPKRVVHDLREGEPGVLRAKCRDLCAADSTTASPPLEEATTGTLPEALVASSEESEREHALGGLRAPLSERPRSSSKGGDATGGTRALGGPTRVYGDHGVCLT